MATIDVERPAPAAPLPPSDPNVVIPERVKAAAALAESFYKPPADAEAQPPATTPPAEAPPAETPPAEQPDAAAAEAERARLAEQAASEQQQQPTRKKREKLSLPNPPAAQTPPKADVDDNDESWRKRFY